MVCCRREFQPFIVSVGIVVKHCPPSARSCPTILSCFHSSFRIRCPGDPRLHVCQAPNASICVSPCGSILGPFWAHFGSILGPFWVVHFACCLIVDAILKVWGFNQHSNKNRCSDKNQQTRQESVQRQECSLARILQKTCERSEQR